MAKFLDLEGLSILWNNIKTIFAQKSDVPFEHGAGENSAQQKGTESQAAGNYSFAEGLGTLTTKDSEHAEGQYNISNAYTIHSVGVGTSNADRKNALEITKTPSDVGLFVVGIGDYDGTNAFSGATTVQSTVNNIRTAIDNIPVESGGGIIQ